MKYYTICYPVENGEPEFETLSEQDIIDQYWNYWYGKMCEKLGQQYVDDNYTKQDCIDDWVYIHWAVPTPKPD